MDIPDDSQERKSWMMNLLQDYGREFLIFELADQPNVFAAPETEYRDLKSGNLNPRELKSWQYLDFTLKVLQVRYDLFGGGCLVSECPVHKLLPLKGERPEDFQNCFQLTAEGSIKFRCRRSIGCRRRRCDLKSNRTIDLYDLVAMLEGKSLEYARQVISAYYEAYFGRKLGHFVKTDEAAASPADKPATVRYSVFQKDLEKLFTIPIKGHGSGERFIGKALELICDSPEAEYDGYHSIIGDSVLLSKAFDWERQLHELGPASRLFIWLHWKQAKAGTKLKLTVSQVAQELGINERTLQKHKALLQHLEYLKVEAARDNEWLWTVLYNPRSGSGLE